MRGVGNRGSRKSEARRNRHPAGAGGRDRAALRRANPPGAGARADVARPVRWGLFFENRRARGRQHFGMRQGAANCGVVGERLNSSLKSHSSPRERMIGSAEKRTFTRDYRTC